MKLLYTKQKFRNDCASLTGGPCVGPSRLSRPAKSAAINQTDAGSAPATTKRTILSALPASLAFLFTATLFVVAPGSVSATAIENRFVRFEFSDKDGSIEQITDLKTNVPWLSPGVPRRLVKLIQRTPEKSSNILLSNDAGRPDISRSGDTLTIRFPNLRDGAIDTGIALTVRVRLPVESPEAFFTLEIENRGTHPIVEAWFPFIGGRAGATGAGDKFTTSYGTQTDLYERFNNATFDTHAFGQHLQRIGMRAAQLLPMLDLTTPTGGLSYIMYEKRPRPTDFVYENLLGDPRNVTLGWAWVSTVLLDAGSTYRSPDFGIGVHAGGWHATADRLRSFMEPWWKASPRAAMLNQKIGLFHVQVKGFNGEPYNEFNDLPAIARDSQKYGINDLMFWDYTASVYCRPDAEGDFWEMPAKRETMLRSALKEIKDMGVQVSACVNYRLINETSRAWQRVGSEAQYSFFGVPLYGNASGSMNGAIYINKYYDQAARSLSQGTEKFNDFAVALTRQTLDLGLNSLFIDQAYEGQYSLPKNPRGLDPFEVMDRSYRWFGDAAKMAYQRDPDSYAIAEVPDLWNVPLLDGWWVWGWHAKGWPSLEVFKYVMPEACFIWCTDEFQRPFLAKGFALGSFLAIATRGMTGRLSDVPAYAEQIARLGQLRKKTAMFASQGRFVDKRGLIVAGGDGYVFTSKVGLAVALANGNSAPAELSVEIEPKALTDRRLIAGTVHLEDGREIAAQPTMKNGRWTLSVTLPEYAAAIWTIPFAE